jgi:hypothetical protein
VIFASADVSHVDHFESCDTVYVDAIDMCGRYSLGLSNEEVYDGLEARLPQLFEQGRPRWERDQDHRPRYDTSTSAHAELRIGIMSHLVNELLLFIVTRSLRMVEL